MMPWEHAAVGYVVFSVFVHVVYRDSPTARETIVVVFASVLPDLIDKPLAWQFGVLDASYALGHSVLFAVPLSLAVGVVAFRRGRPRLGWAFGIGYLLHLPGDVLPSYARDGTLPLHRLLWPISDGGGGPRDSLLEGFTDNLNDYVSRIAGELLSGEPSVSLVFLLGLAFAAVLLWLYDGMPVVREGYRLVRRSSGRRPN